MKTLAKLICIFVALSIQSVAASQDPTKLKGPDECGECHKAELKAWKKTHHSKTYSKMHKTKEAKAIKKKMGIKRIKSESACIDCHYTSLPKRKKVKPVAGISCESCHSAGKEWIDIHSEYGGKDIKKADETAVHKKMRLDKVKELGMIGHNDIYALASNCFACHTVPNEKLVNVGGHEAGSKFELVSWSQGEVRHNFLRSADGKVNVESSTERKRVLYVVGRSVDLEFSIRALAEASEKGKYADNMIARINASITELKKISKAQKIAQVNEIVSIAGKTKLVVNNKMALLKTADQIAAQTKKFAQSNDGKAIAGVDKLITAKYKK